MRRAAERYRANRSKGFSEVYSRDSMKWHMSRAQGHQDRVERVLDCGCETIEVRCENCGRTHERGAGCRIRLLCVRCRDRIAKELRARFMSARKAVVATARQRGLLDPTRPRGRWSEKLVTLTAPHAGEHSVQRRIVLILDAWGHFRRRLRRYLKERRAEQTSHWFRVFEWTIGMNDQKGHPHIHLWVLSPFLPQDELWRWWRQALLEAGYSVHQLSMLNRPDIREVTNPDEVSLELVKYMTKDIDPEGQKLPAELYAEVYKAFDGRRVTQASAGFMKLAERDLRCDCGANVWRTTRKSATA